jgi:glycosyltransferase involved in cell wall biosynthesis
MRIRFITCTPMNVRAGSGTFVGISTLANQIRALGIEVDLVVPTFRLPVFTAERFIFNQALRFQNRTHYDVTVGFDMDGYTIAGRVSEPYIASIKGVIADEMRFESGFTRASMGLQARCEKMNVHRSTAVLTTSQYASQRIQTLYGLTKPPIVVPELIDLAGWQKLSNANPARPVTGKFTILSVCRFYPRKRLHLLLGAAARLRSKIPGIEVRIVGGGPEFKRLQKICRDKHWQGMVTWCRDISQSELAREYNSCQIFCLPSVQEGFGIVFLEAMAHGKPIVAARAGAAPEVVAHGVLVDPDNETALADGIEFLYRNPDQRAQLGALGRQFVKQFDAPVVAKRFLQELKPFIAESKAQHSLLKSQVRIS